MTPEHRKLLESIAETRFPDEDETSNLAAIALAEIDSLTARLEAVKAMHQPREFLAYVENQLVPETPRLCRACDEDWPCPTVRAAEGKP